MMRRAILFIGFFAAQIATGAPFGESKTVNSGVPTCPGGGVQDNSGVLTAMPISIDVPSRLFVTVTMTTGYHLVVIYAALTRGTAMPAIGVTEQGAQAWQSGQEQQQRPPIAVQGIIHAGSTPIDPAASPLVLDPGQYQLQLRIMEDGNCGGPGFGTFGFGWATMTYLILSSVPDRIYANGFV